MLFWPSFSLPSFTFREFINHMETTTSSQVQAASPFSAVFSMFYEPTKTFNNLSPKRYGWLPLLLVMASTLTLFIWYYSTVDFAWLQEQMVASLPAPDREASKQFMTKGVLMGGTIFGVLVFMPVMMVITAVYLLLVSKALNKPFTFYDGFSLSAWSSITAVLSLPLGAMQILMSSNHQFSFSELNPLSLNQLAFHHEMGHPLTSLLDSISIPMVWGMVLMVIGYQVWAKVSRTTALAVTLVPYGTIYGIWLAFAMSKAV